MDEVKNDPFNLLSILSKDELEQAIEQKIEQFHGLLTRDAAMKLIAKEKGLLKYEERVFKIKDIPKAGRKINFTATIVRILPQMKYSTGKISRSMIVKDDTGTIALKLWANDLQLFLKFKLGDSVEVKNAYERNGELGLGYSGEVKLVSASAFVPLSELQQATYVNVRAKIAGIKGERTYTKEGSTKRFFVFSISDGTKEKECVIWETLSRGTRLKPGDEIIIERAYVKQESLYVYGNTRMLVKSANAIDNIESMECDGEKLVIVADGKKKILERNDALKLLGVNIADDVLLSTVVNLKKDAILKGNIKNNPVG